MWATPLPSPPSIRHKRSVRRVSVLAAVLLSLSLVSCKDDGPTKTPGGSDASPDEADGPTGPAETRHEMLANSASLDELHPSNAPNTAGILAPVNHHETAYDASAPATVLVATSWGHGSGVIIDSAGWVLTNYHVIENAETADFGIRTEVTVPDIREDGSAIPGKRYTAVAYKVDPKRDIALLKIESDEDFPVAPLAQDDPRPGSRVAAIGNAGVGFGWAIKHCSINAVGTMESAAQVIFTRQHQQLAEKHKEQVAKAAKKAAEEAGTLIQTDCTVLPGDSGGPLIDETTHQVVGLNVAVKPWTEKGQQLGSVAFHIHVKELRDFMNEVPDKPPRFVPDPWELGGAEGIAADVDKDGELDTLKLMGMCGTSSMCAALFVDVNQDSFKKGEKIPSLEEIYEGRIFDPEFVLYERGRLPRELGDPVRPRSIMDELFYFDSDDDGTLDGVLVKDGEDKTVRGYRRTAVGLEADPSLKEIGPDLFKTQALKERFAAYRVAFGGGATSNDASRTSALEVEVMDKDGDGVMDTALANTRLDERLMIDVDGDGKLGDNLADRLGRGDVDVEFLVVAGSPYRVYYDTDGDGNMDTLLETRRAADKMAQDAWKLDKGGKKTPLPDLVGRHVYRPELIPGEVGAKLRKLLLANVSSEAVAADEGLGSFPPTTPAPFCSVQAYDDSNDYLVAIEDVGRVMVQADLDRNSYPKSQKKRDPKLTVREGKFDPEFVFAYDGGIAWAFYDADGKGSWDTILVSHAGSPLVANHKFTVAKDGTVAGAPVEGKQPMLDPALITSKKLRGRFTKVKSRVEEKTGAKGKKSTNK